MAICIFSMNAFACNCILFGALNSLNILGADPYFIIKCEGESVRSSTKQDTVNPEFSQSAIFFRKNPLKKPIKIQVCEWLLQYQL